MAENPKSAQENTSFFRDVFKERWRSYRSQLKSCQSDPTEEAVHDLRVATRRLLALIDLFRSITPHPRLPKLRRMLKDQLDDLDDLRDTQVMLVGVSNLLADCPEIEPFQKYLYKREIRLLRSASKSIKSFNYSGFRKAMETVPKKVLQETDAVLNSLSLQVLDERYEAIMRRRQRVDPSNPRTIHRMRIALKKFRYTVEIVHALVPNFPEENFKTMHAYQDMMGNIQDAEVLLSVFEDFAEGDGPYNPEPVLRCIHQRHKESIEAFMKDIGQLDSFWRPAPESPFPWEIKQKRKKGALKKKVTGKPSAQEKDENGVQVEAGKDAGAGR